MNEINEINEELKEDSESDNARDCKKIVQMPRRRDHRPNIYEVNMG